MDWPPESLEFNTQAFPKYHQVKEYLPNPERNRIRICRCWQSKKFPFCDDTHKQLVEAGDNIGPMIMVYSRERRMGQGGGNGGQKVLGMGMLSNMMMGNGFNGSSNESSRNVPVDKLSLLNRFKRRLLINGGTSGLWMIQKMNQNPNLVQKSVLCLVGVTSMFCGIMVGRKMKDTDNSENCEGPGSDRVSTVAGEISDNLNRATAATVAANASDHSPSSDSMTTANTVSRQTQGQNTISNTTAVTIPNTILSSESASSSTSSTCDSTSPIHPTSLSGTTMMQPGLCQILASGFLSGVQSWQFLHQNSSCFDMSLSSSTMSTHSLGYNLSLQNFGYMQHSHHQPNSSLSGNQTYQWAEAEKPNQYSDTDCLSLGSSHRSGCDWSTDVESNSDIFTDTESESGDRRSHSRGNDSDDEII